ncbi:MAG TPA: Mut7-C RNAse domain-containing protein [Aggregatilineales bacterium]|nr:Mut7-C RNAse domain-containing protein [Aggregatilineales bacterium]
MNHAYFRFHDELDYFLPRNHKNTIIEHPFDWRASIKDMIESLGVPHSEIELLVVNDVSVDFAYIVQNEDRVDVYPRFEKVDLPDKVCLRPAIPGKVRFILDTHLGRLAAYLRMLGFDTLYRNDYPDEELAQVSSDENRVLLTRDIGLLKRSLVTYGYFVRNTNPRHHLKEIIRRFNLLDTVEPFKHCMKCNGLLHSVSKDEILNDISAQTAQFYDDFHRCEACSQIYWMGSHYQHMQEFMSQVFASE